MCWYTEHAPDAGMWGIAAFSGRTATHVEDLRGQGEVYSLLAQSRAPSLEVVSSVAGVHAADDMAAWRAYASDPAVSLITSSITEAGYVRTGAGDLDESLEQVRADVAALRADSEAPVATAPGKFVSALVARRSAGGGPITFVPCDNVVGSGAMVRTVVTQMAALVDPTLGSWIDDNVAVISSMVDRITPATRDADIAQVEAMAGWHDPALVVTEAFSEWVLAGEFAGPRPAWEEAGARVVADVTPFEDRKLWLLNGAHSLMAYTGPLRGRMTVGEAIADPVIASWVDQWWDEAGARLDMASQDVTAYRSALLDRFANPAMKDPLSRIAADGSQKIPIRLIPTIRADLAAGRDARAGLRGVAAWVAHVRGLSTPVADARQEEVVALGEGTWEESVAKVVSFMGLPSEVVPVVMELVEEVTGRTSR